MRTKKTQTNRKDK